MNALRTLPSPLVSLLVSLSFGAGLVAAGVSRAHAEAASAPAVAVSAPAGTASSAAAAVRVACPSHAGLASGAAGRLTSKVRHVPVEGDPCAGSTGVSRPAQP